MVCTALWWKIKSRNISTNMHVYVYRRGKYFTTAPFFAFSEHRHARSQQSPSCNGVVVRALDKGAHRLCMGMLGRRLITLLIPRELVLRAPPAANLLTLCSPAAGYNCATLERTRLACSQTKSTYILLGSMVFVFTRCRRGVAKQQNQIILN